jgi:hypothetical protein
LIERARTLVDRVGVERARIEARRTSARTPLYVDSRSESRDKSSSIRAPREGDKNSDDLRGVDRRRRRDPDSAPTHRGALGARATVVERAPRRVPVGEDRTALRLAVVESNRSVSEDLAGVVERRSPWDRFKESLGGGEATRIDESDGVSSAISRANGGSARTRTHAHSRRNSRRRRRFRRRPSKRVRATARRQLKKKQKP